MIFASARLALARALVVFSFVWPFFNFDAVIPGNTMEIDFLLIFVAAGLVPEISLRDKFVRPACVAGVWRCAALGQSYGSAAAGHWDHSPALCIQPDPSPA